MSIAHAAEIWRDYPELVAGVMIAHGISRNADVAMHVTRFNAIAVSRLAGHSEADLPEIQAWRRTFSRMGLKPTQYRCAAESLLRRFKKEGALPRIHPAIDLCNAISLAFAIPIAVFDVARVSGHLEVRYATGTETYLAFSGDTEHPEAHEVIFADEAGQAHARRWTHRQSASSAVRDDTTTVLIAAEAMHVSALTDVQRLIGAVSDAFGQVWGAPSTTAILSANSPRFDW
jgi:DNA/RNA-binding domain of Phe-tRNA-synthetase-like protein